MDIRTYLQQGRPLIFDGAMGTCYAALPGRSDTPCEQANLTHPDEILEIHRAYLQAGCQAIKTNTFALTGADVGESAPVVRAACALAKEAARSHDACVFADLGPADEGTALPPEQAYIRLGELFLQEGLTHFLVETLPTDRGIPEFARWLKAACPEAFLLVSFAVDHGGISRQGEPGERLLRDTAALSQVDAVGFNCVCGPHHLLEYIKTLPHPGKPLSIMPNAGYPTVLGRRTVFQATADYFGEKMEELAHAGVSILGGCCGTTPEHMACLSAHLTRFCPQSSPAPTAQPQAPAPKPNPLWDKLEGGKRILAVELDPPADDNTDFFMAGVAKLRDAGADAVTIADCPIGRPRADSSLLACKVHRELGVQPLPHMTCRDRNLNATKALLLGLSTEGVHNVLLVTGDPIPTEDRDAVKSVFNFNSRKLARYVSSLNEGALSTPFRIYAALNLNVPNFAPQLKLAQEKEACGVSCFLTQPVLSGEALDNLKLARATLKGKILGGIYPPVSHKNACFLNNEIAGMRVCQEIIDLYEGKSKEEAEELAVTISAAIAGEVAPYTDGLYLMTPFRRVELICRIIARIEKENRSVGGGAS